jgi:hypothetical protein
VHTYLPASIAAGVDFAAAYAVIAWLCWLPNVIVAEWVYNTAHAGSSQRTAVGGR